MTEPHFWSAAATAEAFAAGRTTPLEMTRTLLAHIARYDPVYNAFIRVEAESALREAETATAELAAGRRRGPLHGVAFAVKDIIDVAGLPTTCHSKILLDHVAAADAPVVARLRAQGAILLGKLSTHEFALGGPAFDLPFPPARNPWNPDHHPGGSSSGSGAGLAAGLFPLSLGSDTGGSTRNPASVCGLVGLKPTYGLLPRTGVFPLSFTLDHVGPIARCVEDVALLTEATAGHDAGDPGSAATPPRGLSADLSRGVRGLRIGFVRHFHEKDMVADPQVAAALEAAVALLAREGAMVTDVTLPSLTRFAAVNRVILHSEAVGIHGKWLRERPGDYAQLTRSSLLTGLFMTAEDYVRAQRARREMIAAVEDVFRDVDILVCASAMEPAVRIEDAKEVARSYPRHARTPFNVTGHPALAMMSGLSQAGLPLSVQFVGRYFEERTLLRCAAAFERAMGLPKHPTLA
jgi:aspartyl-tRNA(Asn)/glutamyl-tRNA(Gln) amidotransferase subunit A